MQLMPTAIIKLTHRAYFLRGASQSKKAIVASEDGFVSIIDTLRAVPCTRLAQKIRAVSPHPAQPLLAWVNDREGVLVVQGFEGEHVTTLAPPRTRSTIPSYIPQGFTDCFFDEDGEHLWVAAHISDEEVELSLVDTRTWSFVKRAVVKDPFGESTFSFHSTMLPGRTSFWMAAGQNGQHVYWLNPNQDGFCCNQELILTNTIPPVFCSDGSKFLVTDERNELCCYDFSTGKKLGQRVSSPLIDDPFAESLCYLDDNRALVSTNDGRVFLIDTNQMVTLEEVFVSGHVPRPIGEYFPNLANERGLATDISWFGRVGNAIAFVCRRDGGVGLEGWKDSLLWYSV